MRTLSSVELPSAEDAERAVPHLKSMLFRYDCEVWSVGSTLKISLNLQGESATQRMAAWRRIVTEELAFLEITIKRYE
jgi:hypothetical protein